MREHVGEEVEGHCVEGHVVVLRVLKSAGVEGACLWAPYLPLNIVQVTFNWLAC